MKSPSQVASPPDKPLLIYDGDCAFCTRWIARWKRLTGDAVDYLASRDAGPRFPELLPADLQHAVHLVDVDGRVFSAAEAVLRSLSAAGRFRWVLWMYQSVPGCAALMESAYEFVARRRHSC